MRPVPLKEENQFLLKAEDLERHITEKTKLLILNFPHNPTGQVLLREDLEPIARVAARHNILVVADDIYNGMLYDGAEYFPLAKEPGMKERTLIIGSFSKPTPWTVGVSGISSLPGR